MEQALKKANQRLELKKHVNAIHCGNSLTLVQRKLFNALLFNAYPSLSNKKFFEIKVQELCRLIGYNSNDILSLKKALLSLVNTAIEWDIIDSRTGQGKQWKACAILASACLESGLCRYEYSELMKEQLYRPEMYGRIDIQLLPVFKSSYGLALYENCIRYQGLAQTPWFTLETFRKLMGVFGDKYKTFADFKRRVLNTALNEVNRLSSIKLTSEIKRVNQKVTEIRFKLERRVNLEIEAASNEKDSLSSLKIILTKEFGLSERSVHELLSEFGLNDIQEKINLIKGSNSFQSGSIQNLSGYLVNALRKDYKPGKSSREITVLKRREKQAIKHAEQEAKQRRQEAYDKYVSQKITTFLTTVSKQEHESLLAEFLDEVSNNTFLLKLYNEHGIEHPGVRGPFYRSLLNSGKGDLSSILSMEAFLEILKTQGLLV